MKRVAPLAVLLAMLSAPAFAFSVDMGMPNLTFPDDTVTQGTIAPSTLPTTDQATR